jgi:hypothetical protein
LAVAIDVPRWRRERDDPLRWRLGEIVPPIVTILLAILGAVATVTTSFGGLSWLAAAMASLPRQGSSTAGSCSSRSSADLLLSGVRVAVAHGAGAGDAGNLSRTTHIPSQIWALLWLAGTLLAVVSGGKWLILRS